MIDDLRLRPGTVASTAVGNLDDLITRARNLVAGASGRDPRQFAGQYLSWLEDAERSVRHLFTSPVVWQQFHTSRHEEIRRIDNRTARPVPLISMETEAQAERLAAIVDRLRHEQQAFEMPAGLVAVLPDTNVFIHYRRYDQIDWPTEVGSKAVRLIVPLLVIDQLDEKSYASLPLGDRASGVLKALRKLRGDDPPEKPLDVRQGVELQVLMDPLGHQRRANSDDEFLTRSEHVAAIVGGNRVVVTTSDHGMQLRAAARRLRCLSTPERLRLPMKRT